MMLSELACFVCLDRYRQKKLRYSSRYQNRKLPKARAVRCCAGRCKQTGLWRGNEHRLESVACFDLDRSGWTEGRVRVVLVVCLAGWLFSSFSVRVGERRRRNRPSFSRWCGYSTLCTMRVHEKVSCSFSYSMYVSVLCSTNI